MPAKVHNLHTIIHINPLFWNNCSQLSSGILQLIKEKYRLYASERSELAKKILLFHTIKVIFSTCVCRFSKILNFLEFFHFPEITWKESGFPGIWEISFKVENTVQSCPVPTTKESWLLDKVNQTGRGSFRIRRANSRHVDTPPLPSMHPSHQ